MENTLGFADKSDDDISADDWPVGKTVASLTAEGQTDSHSQLQTGQTQQNLELVPEKIIHTDRPIVNATMAEKLAYYRAFTSSSSKIEVLCMQQNNLNRLTWFYVFNALCKSLPMTYVYIFLSAYAPDYHFFVPKMVPIFYGLKWINVLCARFLLQTVSYNTATLVHYALAGIIFRAPWNRCQFRILSLTPRINYTCMELEEFVEQFVNNTIIFKNLLYRHVKKRHYFAVAQMEYFDQIYNKMTCSETADQCFLYVTNILIWFGVAALYNRLYSKCVWKILYYAQISLCALLLLIFVHLTISYEDKEIQRITYNSAAMLERQENLLNADLDMLAESMIAPPVVHILTARTTTEIKPSLNSAVIVISNGVHYIFKALTSYLMKKYCERWVNATIIYWHFGRVSIFYYWPLYFATFRYGAPVAVIFFALNAIVEYCMFIITFQCLVEVVKCEWRWIRPWCFSIIILFLAILEIVSEREAVVRYLTKNSFVYYLSLSSLAEVLIIFWIYPLSRLLDDITFHFGVPSTRLRRWSFKLLPVYYLLKVAIMITVLYPYRLWVTMFIMMYSSRHVPTCVGFLLALGAVYAFYDQVIRKKRGFCQLFKPVPEWGPKDFRLRQLRKQFDSRQYIVSQAPRDLSRHLIEKSGLVSYKLDIRYDCQRKSSRAEAKLEMEKQR